MELTAKDLYVIIGYLAGIWGIGLYVAYRRRSHDEGFLVDRRFGWFNIGSSIFATNVGPNFLIGSASAAYAFGMVTANFEWLAWIFLFLLAVCAPHYIRMRITTMPEFIRRRFGDATADFLSWYGLIAIVLVWVGGDMFVGRRLLSQLLGYPAWQCLIALTVIFTSFTVAGGFSAVMVTDTFQSVLMIVSMLVLNVIAFQHVGSVQALIDAVPADHWQLIRPASDADFPWPGIFFGYPVLGFWFWCTDQTIVQRMLGARDLRQAQLGAIYTGFLKILPPFLFMMPGIFCLALHPGLAKSDMAFVTMLTTYMPHGMMGLMISVLFAASVAGVAGGLNAFSTIFTMDIYKRKFHPDASARRLKRTSQVVVVAVAAFAAGAALLLLQAEKNIFDTMQSVIASVAPPVATLFLLGITWKKATAAGAPGNADRQHTLSLCLGLENLFNFPWKGFWPHYMVMAAILFVVCCATMVVVSLLSKHAPYEEDFSAIKRQGLSTSSAGAGKLGWTLWAILAVIMVSLYLGFQWLAHR